MVGRLLPRKKMVKGKAVTAFVNTRKILVLRKDIFKITGQIPGLTPKNNGQYVLGWNCVFMRNVANQRKGLVKKISVTLFWRRGCWIRSSGDARLRKILTKWAGGGWESKPRKLHAEVSEEGQGTSSGIFEETPFGRSMAEDARGLWWFAVYCFEKKNRWFGLEVICRHFRDVFPLCWKKIQAFWMKRPLVRW